MALKSVNDYSNQWGFTEKRLWGYTGVFWMLFVLTSYSYTYFKQLQDILFVKVVIAITVLTLLAINIANFDYLTYHYRKSTTGQGVDHGYLAYLSADAYSYKEELMQSEITMNKSFTTKMAFFLSLKAE